MDFQGARNSRMPGSGGIPLTPQAEFSAAIARAGALYDFDTLTLDESGNGNNLTLINAPVQNAADGRPLASITLSAVALQGATAPDTIHLRTDALLGLTVFSWARRNGGGAVFRIACKGNVSTVGTHEWTLNYNNASRFQFSIGNGSAIFTVTDANVSIADLTWYFVMAQILPGGIIRISVNGSAWTTALYTGSALVGSNILRVGFDTTGRYWNGDLDGLGILPYVCSDGVRDMLYNAGAGRLLTDLV